jgi:chromosomal replication initiation ATPase DnaA
MSTNTNLTLSQIKILVSKDLKINIKKNSRIRKYVYGRAIYFKLCKEFTHASLAEIGESVNREHATVIHGLEVFNMIALYNDTIMSSYNRIRNALLQEGNQALKRYSEVHYWRIKYEDLLKDHDELLRAHLDLERKVDNHEIYGEKT